MKRFFADPRRCNLAILGALTLAFVALAIFSLGENANLMKPKYEPHLLFPNLKNQLSQLAALRVESKSGKVTVRYDNTKGWIVAEKDGYPADETQLRQTAVAMAELEAEQPLTARPEWLSYVGLGAPDMGGDAVKVTLLDGAGNALATLLIGKSDETTDATGRTGIYVREPGENQAWLARGYLVAKPGIGDWLNKRVLTVSRERIRETSVTPLQSAPYTVMRDNAAAPDFKLAELPMGRSLIYDSAPDGVAAAIVGFTFDDIQRAANFDFTHAAKTNTSTFDGLTIAVKVIQQGQNYWASVLAAGVSPQAQTEAATINAKAGGWAFKLPDYKAKLFLTTLDSLLKPLAAGPPAPSEPAEAPEDQP